MLLTLTESKSIDQIHEFYNSCTATFSAERSHSVFGISARRLDGMIARLRNLVSQSQRKKLPSDEQRQTVADFANECKSAHRDFY